MISQQKVKKYLRYDPVTGRFCWSDWAKQKQYQYDHDRQPGTIDYKGYRRISIEFKQYRAHRLAWLYVLGDWPEQQIDHINGVRDDNRWENLRLATAYENQRNAKRKSTNKSGYKGVYWHKQCQKWAATIRISGKQKYLGVFECPIEAHAAYCQAASRFYGAFARTQ